jgi:hypothetical protein
MNTALNFANNSQNSMYWLLAGLALALTASARGDPLPTTMPFSEIGARATAGYQGDALDVTAAADGARLRCGFQKLEGHATREGLWVESTRPGAAGRLRLTAIALGRESSRARRCALTGAASSVRSGMSIVTVPQSDQAPLGAPCIAGAVSFFDLPLLTESEATFSDACFYRYAAPNGAIACLRQGAQTLARTGTVSAEDKLVRFTRPGLTEEYSVSVDGVRQDFVIAAPPAGAGDLRVELALSGARAEAAAGAARLRLDGSGRALAYSRLRVEDATGRKLTAGLDVLSDERLAVTVADANATYPVRIDPTFSDADWVSLSPGLPGVNTGAYAIAVDGNGNVYVGGGFTFVGTVPANGIAKWDGSAWSALGLGVDAPVHVLAVSGGVLYAGGQFTTAGGVTANYIAKWDGSAWSALGSGMNGYVYALAVGGTDLYVGGAFSMAGGLPAGGIAKWDGSAWSALGSGINTFSDSIAVLAVSGTMLYAGGGFTNIGGVSANRIAKWDGSTWSALDLGMNSYVSALAVSGTNLYAGGLFTRAGTVTANGIARWNGSAWSALGSGMAPSSFEVDALAVSGTDLYAGGWFLTAGGVTANYLAKWDGSAWSALGSGICGGAVNALAVNGTNLCAGGGFTTAGGVLAKGIAEWDGGTWSALGSGMSSSVHALAISGTSLYAAGESGVAKWTGSAWSVLGGGPGGYYSSVSALAASGSDLYAAGSFSSVGGVPANYIARWNGSAWSALGSGMNDYVFALAVRGSDLYAGGHFTTAGGMPANRIAKWNGSTWSALGSGMSDDVYALAVSGTNLYAGGRFTTAGGVTAKGIAKWNGNAWSAIGSGMGSAYPWVHALAVSGTNLYAGGSFGLPANHIAKWDGSAWSALGSGINDYVLALAVSGSDLYAGGTFSTAGGVSANHIAKWDGNAWSALGSGMNSTVWALVADGAEHLFVGGEFSLAGTNVSFYIAEAVLLPSVPTILRTPPTQTAEAGATVILTVDAAGNPPPAYQWYLNGTNILGCANSSLVLTNMLFSQSGTYTVVVTNMYGAVTSAPMVLSVIAPVERRPVPGVKVMGEAGSSLNVDYADALSTTPTWLPLDTISLGSTSQYCFDLTVPLPPQRYYRAWQAATPGTMLSLELQPVPAITVTGNIGDSVRVDCINRFGAIDAWVTLDTVSLTETSQLYFDTSAPGQPERLYRLVPVP